MKTETDTEPSLPETDKLQVEIEKGITMMIINTMIEIEDPEDTMMMTLTKIKHSMIEEEEVGTTEEALDNQEEEETEMEIEEEA